MEFKKLQWTTRADGVVFSEPAGFEKLYYIYPAENDQCELALINAQGICDENETTIHTELDLAKKCAEKHYYNILAKHVFEPNM